MATDKEIAEGLRIGVTPPRQADTKAVAYYLETLLLSGWLPFVTGELALVIERAFDGDADDADWILPLVSRVRAANVATHIVNVNVNAPMEQGEDEAENWESELIALNDAACGCDHVVVNIETVYVDNDAYARAYTIIAMRFSIAFANSFFGDFIVAEAEEFDFEWVNGIPIHDNEVLGDIFKALEDDRLLSSIVDHRITPLWEGWGGAK